MNKIWYIKLNGKKEGPYSIQQLKMHSCITPDTLAWKEGFQDWLPMREIPELKEIFKDEVPLPEPEELEETEEETENKTKFLEKKSSDELTLAMQEGPPPILYWILIGILILGLLLIGQRLGQL